MTFLGVPFQVESLDGLGAQFAADHKFDDLRFDSFAPIVFDDVNFQGVARTGCWPPWLFRPR